MIFEVQQEPFFHLTTEGLPARPDFSRFPAGNPPGDTLAGNFEQVDATHSSFRHDLTPESLAQKVSGAFPSLNAKYTRGQAHLEANHRFLVEPCAHIANLRSDSVEPSVYLPIVLRTKILG